MTFGSKTTLENLYGYGSQASISHSGKGKRLQKK